MVVLWAINKPAQFVEQFAIFPKGRGHDVVNNVFAVVVVLPHVCVVAVVTARRQMGNPLVIFLWEVGVVTVVGGDRRTLRVR